MRAYDPLTWSPDLATPSRPDATLGRGIGASGVLGAPSPPAHRTYPNHHAHTTHHDPIMSNKILAAATTALIVALIVTCIVMLIVLITHT